MAPSRFTALASHTPDSTATDSASKSTKYQEIVRDEFIYACAAGCLNAAIRVLRYNPTTCFLTEIDIAFKCALAGSHWSILKWMWAQNENVGANDLADDTYMEYTDKVITLDEINYMNKLRTLLGMKPIVGYTPKKRVSSTPPNYNLTPSKHPKFRSKSRSKSITTIVWDHYLERWKEMELTQETSPRIKLQKFQIRF